MGNFKEKREKQSQKKVNKKSEKKKVLAKIKKKNKVLPYGKKLDLKEVDWEKIAEIFKPEKKSILKRLEKEIERYPHAKEILYLLAGGGVLAACLVAPGLAMALKPFIYNGKGYQKSRLKQTLKRLKKQKLVEVVETKEEMVVRITKKGKIRALRYKLDEMRIKKPKKWDKKWRIIIFDIPERRKGFRNIFRKYLRQLRLHHLQKSVYVYPFPCFDEIEFLRQIFGVGFNVTYIVAESIEEDNYLKLKFRLS
ncbi:CRISPR-associated endonuclease Cas2 [Candidatus Microgenomates bacterium]|nr:CRISPR-associated endonuclease Cas2 [Candidatus Microgenomates bacterium]